MSQRPDLVFTRTKDIWAKDNIPVVLICNVKYEGPDNICHNYLDWEVKSDPIPQIVKDTIEQGKGLSGVHLSGMVTNTILFCLLFLNLRCP